MSYSHPDIWIPGLTDDSRFPNHHQPLGETLLWWVSPGPLWRTNGNVADNRFRSPLTCRTSSKPGDKRAWLSHPFSNVVDRASMRMVFGNSSIQDDIYNTTAGAPLGQSLGLRHEYRWGLYHYCAYILEPSIYGVCGNATFALAWTPFETISSDITPEYFVQVNEFIISLLRDSPYLGTLSRVAYWLILFATVATICVIPLFV